MIILIIVVIVLVSLVLIAKNSGKPNSVKEANWAHKQNVRRSQRPLGFIFLGLFILLVIASLVIKHQ
jgi:ABC-type Fe3+ transport system permease subunit